MPRNYRLGQNVMEVDDLTVDVRLSTSMPRNYHLGQNAMVVILTLLSISGRVVVHCTVLDDTEGDFC